MGGQRTFLFELYHAYKDSTKYAVDWLWSASAFQARRSEEDFTPSTQDIVDAAAYIRPENTPVPSSVISSLSDAIKKRRQVADIYENTSTLDRGRIRDVDGSRHRAFVSR